MDGGAMHSAMKRIAEHSDPVEESLSPPRKLLCASPIALQFVVSPKILPGSEAIRVKEAQPEAVSLMPVQNRELSLEEARVRAGRGEDILVSPRGMQTNDAFTRMRQVPYSMRFSLGGMVGQILKDGQGVSAEHQYDLAALKQTLPSP